MAWGIMVVTKLAVIVLRVKKHQGDRTLPDSVQFSAGGLPYRAATECEEDPGCVTRA
jgi:hypothetical protein